MYKKTIKYTDFDDNERTEDFYFNLTKAELLELTMSTSGGLDNYLKKIIDAQDQVKIMELFKKIITMSYGEKSLDGKKFVKNPELLEDFMATNAYSELYTELATNSDAAIEFVKGIIPKEMAGSIEGSALPVITPV